MLSLLQTKLGKKCYRRIDSSVFALRRFSRVYTASINKDKDCFPIQSQSKLMTNGFPQFRYGRSVGSNSDAIVVFVMLISTTCQASFNNNNVYDRYM